MDARIFVTVEPLVFFRIALRSLLVGILVVGEGGGGALQAQAPSASAYPVDPAAAAGMTSGLPNGITNRQAEMMQVRTSAQEAQGEAVAASMARSVDETLEERNRELAIQSAREKKSIKQDIANRLRFEKAAESYNKVSAHDMSTWKTQSGGVRVERNVPDAFLMALIHEEEENMARGGETREKKGFPLFRRGGSGEVSEPEARGSFFSARRPQRLSDANVGSQVAPAAMVVNDTSEPTFAQAARVETGSPSPPPNSGPPSGAPMAASASVPEAAPVGRSGNVPRISGAELLDGGAPTRAAVSSADRTPEPAKKGGGLFSLFRPKDEGEDSLVPTARSESRSGGFFGFGRKRSEAEVGKIDASLFPAGAVDQAPTGAPLSGNYAAADVAVAASSSTGSIELPGQTVERTRGSSTKPGLSLPSLPSVPSLVKSERTAPGIPTMTTVNSAGSSYYSVASTAQFMVYGADPMQSEIRAIPAGTVVLMTKPGEQWASIRLPDGTEGVVQNKNLKPAAGGGSSSGGGEFAASAQ